MRLCAAFVLAATSCGGEKQSAAPASDPWATGSAASITRPLPVIKTGPWRLVVEDRGSEPRALVRYQLGTIDRELRVRMIDDDHAQDLTTMRYRWTCSPCRYRMTAFSPAGDAPPEIQKDFDGIAKQVHGEVVVPPDGHVEIRPATLMGTTPSTTELLELAIVPFPSEPIGLGARWTVTDGPKTKRLTLTTRSDHGAWVALMFDAEVPSAKVHAEGTLEVSLVDPIAKGTLKQTQGFHDPSTGTHRLSLRSTLTID